MTIRKKRICEAPAESIEGLFRTHFAQMRAVALAMLHDEEAAQDVVHDVFAQLLDARAPRLVGAPYLLRAVRNRCLNHIHRCEIHERVARNYFVETEEYRGGEWPDDETLARLRTLIASRLTEQEARIIELRFGGGKRFAEVAAEMGISQTAVFRHLRRALTLIRQNFDQNG